MNAIGQQQFAFGNSQLSLGPKNLAFQPIGHILKAVFGQVHQLRVLDVEIGIVRANDTVLGVRVLQFALRIGTAWNHRIRIIGTQGTNQRGRPLRCRNSMTLDFIGMAQVVGGEMDDPGDKKDAEANRKESVLVHEAVMELIGRKRSDP